MADFSVQIGGSRRNWFGVMPRTCARARMVLGLGGLLSVSSRVIVDLLRPLSFASSWTL